MRFHFNYKPTGDGKNSFQATVRLERRQREQKVGESVSPGQRPINRFAVKAIRETLLTRLK
jgi:hypothetical protein